jgi:hypothetical protein
MRHPLLLLLCLASRCGRARSGRELRTVRGRRAPDPRTDSPVLSPVETATERRLRI